jgi:hypothetical protein
MNAKVPLAAIDMRHAAAPTVEAALPVAVAPSLVIADASNLAAHDRAAFGNVLAVLDGTCDDAAVRLAVSLARECSVLVDLLLLAEVPVGLPMEAYGEWLLASDDVACLAVAEQLCGPTLGDSSIQLCRSAGPALVEAARERRASCLVIGAPGPGWWMRRRARRAIAHAQAYADCRVYVTNVPAPAMLVPAASWRHIFG